MVDFSLIYQQDLVEQLNELEEEKQKIQNELELSRYLCGKQLADLKTKNQDISGLQKTMVRCYVSNMEVLLIRSQDCDPFVLFLVDGDITKVKLKMDWSWQVCSYTHKLVFG